MVNWVRYFGHDCCEKTSVSVKGEVMTLKYSNISHLLIAHPLFSFLFGTHKARLFLNGKFCVEITPDLFPIFYIRMKIKKKTLQAPKGGGQNISHNGTDAKVSAFEFSINQFKARKILET